MLPPPAPLLFVANRGLPLMGLLSLSMLFTTGTAVVATLNLREVDSLRQCPSPTLKTLHSPRSFRRFSEYNFASDYLGALVLSPHKHTTNDQEKSTEEFASLNIVFSSPASQRSFAQQYSSNERWPLRWIEGNAMSVQ